MSVSVKGLDQLLKNLDQLSDKIARKASSEGMLQAMQVVLDEAKKQVPQPGQSNSETGYEPTGELKDSLYLRKGKSRKDYISVVVDCDSRYGNMVEYGGIQGDKVLPANPFMKRAYLNKGDQALGIAIQKITEIAEKEAQK